MNSTTNPDPRYGVLVDALDEGVVFQDRDGRVVYSNPAASRILGLTADQLVGRTAFAPEWHSSFEDGSSDPSRHPCVVALKTGRPVSNVVMHAAPTNGRAVCLSVNARPVFEVDDASPSGVVVSFTDIKERLDAEEALRRSETRHAALLQYSTDVVIVIDKLGGMSYVSPSAPGLLGYPHGTHLGTEVLGLVHPDDRERALDALAERAVSTEHLPPFVVRVAHADGGWRDLELVASNLIDDPAVQGVVVNARDITERREAEASVRASEDRLSALLRYSSDIIVVTDATGVLQLVSPAAERMLGFEISSWIGRNVLDLVHPDDREQATASLLNTATVAGAHEPIQLRITNADGTWRTVEVVANNLLGVPSINGIVVNARDISDRLRSEAALREAELDRQRREAELERNRLEAELAKAQRLEGLGRLAGGVAHDFNNLLGVILNYAGFVTKRLDPSDPIAADVTEIRRAAERATELTRQLLLFGRREVVRAAVFDLNDVIASAAPLFRRTLGDVELVVDLTSEPVPVFADRGQIEQVLMNLLLNARDATSGRGLVTVRTRCHDVFDGPRSGSYVELSVSDDGSGMTPEVLDRAFEPFFTTKSRDRGSGLGLASVHGIVSRAGGDVAIETQTGVGTTVSVTLKLSERDAGNAQDSVAPKLLVVDDEPEVRAVTARILREGGYCVIEARNGSDALARVRSDAKGVALVITDVVMPDMSGSEVARVLRAIRPDIGVLLMSGYAHDDLGSDDEVRAPLLTKPFHETELLDAVRQALNAAALA